MKQRFSWMILIALVLGICAPPVFAQATGSVKGVVRDGDGKTVTEGTVEWLNLDTGRKYTLKLNKRASIFLGYRPREVQSDFVRP